MKMIKLRKNKSQFSFPVRKPRAMKYSYNISYRLWHVRNGPKPRWVDSNLRLLVLDTVHNQTSVVHLMHGHMSIPQPLSQPLGLKKKKLIIPSISKSGHIKFHSALHISSSPSIKTSWLVFGSSKT